MKYVFIIYFFVLTNTVFAASTEPYIVTLFKGAKLVSLEDGSTVITEHDMIVYALETDEENRDKFWIFLNSKTNKKYITDAIYLTNFGTDLKLLPEKDMPKVYQSPPDHQIALQSNFTLSAEILSMNSLNSIYTEQTNSATATRYEFKTLFKSEFPVHFGLNLNYQSIYWDNGDEKIRLSILNLGPSFSYNLLKSEALSVFCVGSGEYAPFAQSYSTQHIDNFEAYAFDLGFEAELPKQFGTFTLGTHFRQQYLILKDTNRTNYNLYSSEYVLSSLGLSLGYRMDWDL